MSLLYFNLTILFLIRFALVDFGLAQTYEKKNENIFEYESTNARKSNNTKGESTPVKHNLISLPKNYKQNSKETTSRISVTNSSKLNLDTSQDKNAEVDLMPIAPAKENKLGIEKQPILLLFMQFVYIYQNF
jgi:hypothetical protein